VGRNQLDGATLNRFAVFDVDYDESFERALFGNTDWVRYVQKVRRNVTSQKMRHIVSMRASRDGQKLLDAGMNRSDVEHAVLWKGLDVASIEKVR
jgi:cobalamin biosynthesis protein CobD/CbiB